MGTVEPAPGRDGALQSGEDAQPFPPWGWKECLAGIGIVVAALVVAIVTLSAIVGRRPAGAPERVSGLYAGLGATICFEVALFIVAMQLAGGRRQRGLQLLGWRWRAPGTWWIKTLQALGLSYVALFTYIAITRLPGLGFLQPKSNVPRSLFDHPETLPLAIALTIVAAPIAEETFFRGFLFGGLRRRLGFSGAAALSGVLFAVLHAAPTLVIPFTVIGVIFAYTYLRAGTLWANVATHFLFNLVSVVIELAGRGAK